MNYHDSELVTFYDLKWDTNFFGVKCAKAILHESLSLNDDWDHLRKRIDNYHFVSIENRNSDPINTQIIGRNTSAFLADVNIQFSKQVEIKKELPLNIFIHQALEEDEQIIKLTEFPFSKFTEDIEFASRGGSKVYSQWVINAFKKLDKYFAISKDNNGDINGYLLHSYTNDTCVIELIAVSPTNINKGIGKQLFKVVENAAYERGIEKINVGTQIRNMQAINFYHKVGCKQVGCHQVYHLWNLENTFA